MKKYFGTDGIRGIPNENLSQDLISGMARAVEQVLGISSVAVIQDTRSSSKEILDWISKGFSEEVNVFNYGVLPSGSMPILISEFNHDLGIIISASHNPSEYNGVKLINKNGSKLSDELEIAIESEIGKSDLPNSSSVVKETEEGKKAYEQFLLDQIDFNIDNFNLVIDCANGSAYQVIEELFKKVEVQLNGAVTANQLDKYRNHFIIHFLLKQAQIVRQQVCHTTRCTVVACWRAQLFDKLTQEAALRTINPPR